MFFNLKSETNSLKHIVSEKIKNKTFLKFLKMKEFTLKGQSFSKLMSFVSTTEIGEQWKKPIQFVGETLRLYQYDDGPCGFLAVLQAHILINHSRNAKMSNDDLLIQSILDIMKKIRSIYAFCQCFDNENKELMFYTTKSESEAREFLINSGILEVDISLLLLLISIAYISGPSLLNSFAFRDSFISNNGQTSINFVLLMLTGMPVDSLSDFHSVQGGIFFSGVLTEQEIGFIIVDEDESYSKVGFPFLAPKEKIWIIYYGGHFTTIAYINNQFQEYNNIDKSPNEFTICSNKHILYGSLTNLLAYY